MYLRFYFLIKIPTVPTAARTFFKLEFLSFFQHYHYSVKAIFECITRLHKKVLSERSVPFMLLLQS